MDHDTGSLKGYAMSAEFTIAQGQPGRPLVVGSNGHLGKLGRVWWGQARKRRGSLDKRKVQRAVSSRSRTTVIAPELEISLAQERTTTHYADSK